MATRVTSTTTVIVGEASAEGKVRLGDPEADILPNQIVRDRHRRGSSLESHPISAIAQDAVVEQLQSAGKGALFHDPMLAVCRNDVVDQKRRRTIRNRHCHAPVPADQIAFDDEVTGGGRIATIHIETLGVPGDLVPLQLGARQVARQRDAGATIVPDFTFDHGDRIPKVYGPRDAGATALLDGAAKKGGGGVMSMSNHRSVGGTSGEAERATAETRRSMQRRSRAENLHPSPVSRSRRWQPRDRSPSDRAVIQRREEYRVRGDAQQIQSPVDLNAQSAVELEHRATREVQDLIRTEHKVATHHHQWEVSGGTPRRPRESGTISTKLKNNAVDFVTRSRVSGDRSDQRVAEAHRRAAIQAHRRANAISSVKRIVLERSIRGAVDVQRLAIGPGESGIGDRQRSRSMINEEQHRG